MLKQKKMCTTNPTSVNNEMIEYLQEFFKMFIIWKNRTRNIFLEIFFAILNSIKHGRKMGEVCK